MVAKLQEKRFKKEYAHDLLKIAAGDLESAKGLAKLAVGREENICFHAHQAIEKSFKAVLVGMDAWFLSSTI